MAKTLATTLKNQALHPSFELVTRKTIDALMLEVTVSRHSKTGALHYHLAHSSDENAFLVAFRTQPMDSKGTAHVLEHTALCGSQKYPVRDPFFSMIKRSLQTFMNAFTASDWTAYPFATQNKKDFDNLLSVYLDASFFPNLHPLDFAQEGIRVELNENDEPEFKGIVFNEMKGAMSGEVDQLYHALSEALHPDTTYHYNSGGDPVHITELTHKDLKDFHQAHYHPSNAILMSFGNRPLQEIQEQCHEQALSHFGQGKKFTSVAETRLSKPVHVTQSYAVDEVTEKQTHHVLAWLLPSMIDPKKRLTLRLIEGVLSEHSGSPLRAMLESSQYGTAPSPLVGLDDNNYEMAFYAGIRGSEPEHFASIEVDILKVLTEVASKPIAQSEIDMVLHQIELNQRHIGGDGMPYGLTLLLDGLSTAVHDGNAVDVWEVQPHLDWLNEKLKDENWLPSQIKKLLLDNPHRVLVSMIPDAEKSARLETAEQKKLNKIAQELTDSDIRNLHIQAKSLAERQAQEDDLSLLPKVGFEDIPDDIEFAEGDSISLKLFGHDSKLYRYTAGTNGIYYTQVVIPLPEEILSNPLSSLYISLLGELGTEKYSSAQFQSVQALHSGGIGVKMSQRTSLTSPDTMDAFLVISIRSLDRKTEALDILQHCMQSTVFTDVTRVNELLQQKYARWKSRLVQSGHAYALQMASSSFSKLAGLNYMNSGIPAFLKLKKLLADFNAGITEAEHCTITSSLNELTALHAQIMSLPKDVLMVAEEDKLDKLVGHIVMNWQKPSHDQALVPLTTENKVIKSNTAWLVQTNVYHNAMCFPAVPADHKDTPALMILGGYLKNNYLHRAIREQGGAYGAGAGYDANACTFRFFSYRDPRFSETYDDFYASINWLLTADQSSEWLNEAIMGMIAGIDKPGSPAGEAIKVCFAGLHGRTPAWQKSMRQALLKVTLADLKRVADIYLKDKEGLKVSLAPYAAEDMLTETGFDVKKMAS